MLERGRADGRAALLRHHLRCEAARIPGDGVGGAAQVCWPAASYSSEGTTGARR